jgi:RNA polymerase sigma-70 factor (ECF subfamily)
MIHTQLEISRQARKDFGPGGPVRLPVVSLTDEEREIQEAKADSARFRPLYDRYYERIFKFLYQRLDDKEDAYDLCSQVFLKALTNLGKYRSMGLPFSSWLYRIARNELNLFFRRSKTQRTVNIETEGLHQIIDEMEESRLDEYGEALIQAVAALDAESLEMIEMRYFEKMSFREIGEILQITENNAKVRVYRILDRLKKTLTKNQKS